MKAKRTLLPLALVSACACTVLGNPDGKRDTCVSRETVAGEAPSLLPQGREFKLVWNEEEASLPQLTPVTGCYYRWNDFKEWADGLIAAHPQIDAPKDR